jgi:hypothetical protein
MTSVINISPRERYVYLIMLLGTLFGFSVLTFGSQYAWPNLENISESRANTVGIWDAWIQALIFFDGRYTTNLLHTLSPLSFGWLRGYEIMPIVSLLFFVGSIVFFMFTFFDNTKALLLYCLLFVSIHFALSPSIAYEFFNMVSGFVYLWSACYWLIWVASTYRWLRSNRPYSAWYVCASVFLVVSIGANEMFLIINPLTLLGIAWIAYKQNLLSKFFPLLIIGALSIVFFFACSGSIQRIKTESTRSPYANRTDELFYAFKHYAKAIKDVFVQSFLLFPLYLLMLRNMRLKTEVRLFLDDSRNRYLLASLTIVTILLMSAPFYLYKTSNGVFPERVFSLIAIYIQLFAMFWITWKFPNQRFPLSTILPSCMLLAMVLGNNNYTKIIAEWRSGSLQESHSRYLSNHEKLTKASKSNESIKVVEIPGLVHTRLKVHEPSVFSNNLNWNTRVLENYYQLDEVQFTSTNETKIPYLQKRICDE